MWSNFLKAAALALTVVGGGALAAPYDNPKPDEQDVVLPGPGGLQFAFRRVKTPGDGGFWPNTAFQVPLGDSQNEDDPNRIFENQSQVVVPGVFKDHNGDWHYLLGKYEVTRAQAAAILGDGDLNAGLALLAEQSGDPDVATIARLQGRARERALAQPVRGLAILDVHRLIDQFNQWCFADTDCFNALPRLEGAPGYARLPTEIEWEYAARGGLAAVSDGTFEEPAPFNTSNRRVWRRLAHINSGSGPISIGEKQPTRGGFYDLYGNVSEICAGMFTPEMLGGRPSGVLTRGPSFVDQPDLLRASLRRELAAYQVGDDRARMEPQRSLTTGFRLGMGSSVVVNREFRRTIAAEYAMRRNDASGAESSSQQQASMRPGASVAARNTTLGGMSLAQPSSLSREPLEAILELTDTLKGANGAAAVSGDDVANIALQISRNAVQVRTQIARQNAVNALRLTRLAVNAANAYSSNASYVRNAQARIDRMGGSSSQTVRRMIAGLRENVARAEANRDASFRTFKGYFREMRGYGDTHVRRSITGAAFADDDNASDAAKRALRALIDAYPGGAPISDRQLRQALDDAYRNVSFE